MMHADNPDTTRAIRILRDTGWSNMTVSDAVERLIANGFRPSALSAISLDDAIQAASNLRSYDRTVMQMMQEMAR
jgi:hypothetical protein